MNPMIPNRFLYITCATLMLACSASRSTIHANSSENIPALPGTKYVKIKPDGSLVYIPDEKRNIIPDFSRVGFYEGDKEIPDIPVVRTLTASGTDADYVAIQKAIDEVSKQPTAPSGYKGAILLKKGLYRIPTTIRIETSGIILKGEGDGEHGTRLSFTAT